MTPETAYATRVKLEHLRWYAGKLSPRKYGAVRPVTPEIEPEERWSTVIIKRFTDAPVPELGGLELGPGEMRRLSVSKMNAEGDELERIDVRNMPMEDREAWSRIE